MIIITIEEVIVIQLILILLEIKPENLLTTAEKQHIVLRELQNIRAQAEDDILPGYPQVQLYSGQSICMSHHRSGARKQGT